MIGDSNIGKSSIIQKYMKNEFDPNIPCTHGVDFRIMIREFNNYIIKIHNWDTTGDTRFYSIKQAYYRNNDGIFLIYDVTNRESFNSLKLHLEYINYNKNKDCPIFLIGNKSDLFKDKEISTEEGKSFANEYNLPFFETSAKNGFNIHNIYSQMIELIYNEKQHKKALIPIKNNKYFCNLL